MCTLALAWNAFEETPVAVAANRDEMLDRPADPPERRRSNPRSVAPRDRRAGGTWIGVNTDGVVAAITNRHLETKPDEPRSRGQLVLDALAGTNAVDAATVVERACRRDEYDGFYLVLVDETAAILYGYDGELARRDLEPGLHVVSNVGPTDDPAIPDGRVDAGRRQVRSARAVERALDPTTVESVDRWLERAESVLGDHAVGVCRHEDGFGTRSSSLIAVDDEIRYRFANGPPCETPYADVDLESHI